MDFWFWTIIFLIPIIIVHELAHNWFTVKLVKAEPLFIAIGIPGFKIFGKQISTVIYTWNRGEGKLPVVFSWLLIGGAIAIKDESYYKTGIYWQKVIMLLAGPLTNLLAGFLISIIFFGFQNGTYIAYEYLRGVIDVIFQTITFQPISIDLSATKDLITSLTPYGLPIRVFMTWNFIVGLFNLFPLPGLDGGGIVTQGVFEITKGKIRPYLIKIDEAALVIWTAITLYQLSTFIW